MAGSQQGTKDAKGSLFSTYTVSGFDEDETMQQAISMSISQNLNEQESGVIQPSEATFSKAERRFYDSQQWSMTFAPHRSREVMQTPDPEHRKREAGAPAVLKPSSSKHYLPQLLTILHAIPMAKEALLARDRLLSDYGMSGDWWSGTAIQDTKIILVEEPAEASAMEDIIFEAQRIMAFLEQTERAYGSAEALALTEGVKNYIRDGTSIQETFLSTWQRAMESCGGESALSGIFQSKAVTYGNQDQMDDEPDIKPFSALAMDSPHEQLESGATLYDAFDALLWGVYDNTGIENTFLEFGDVLVMEWRAPQSDGSGIGIKIPAVWYVDRYLKESIEEATAMRKEKAFLRETIGQIKEVQSNFTMIQDPERLEGKFDARELLDAVRPLLIPQIEEESTFATKLDGHYALDQALDTTMSLTELVKELQIIADRVTEKYKGMGEP